MDKSKRKGKPSRRRLVVLILLIVFSGCILTGILLLNSINNPRYQAPILADIPFGTSNSSVSVHGRILEYVTIGESTRTEVKAFGDENFEVAEYPCLLENVVTETCYQVDIPMWFCNDYFLQIIFKFESDILSDIEYRYQAFGCL